jgi:hypothetical protein
LARFRYAAGWDHAVLAELALYGEIRHVPEVLYFRRDGGKPVRDIARACNEAVQRGHELADQWTDFLWMTPLITTAFNHIDVFSRARVDQSKRLTLIEDAARIFRARWLPFLKQEAELFALARQDLMAMANRAPRVQAILMKNAIADVDMAIATILS